MKTTMAKVIRFSQTGGPEVMQLAQDIKAAQDILQKTFPCA